MFAEDNLKWATSGELQQDLSERSIYTHNAINEFLRQNRIYGIVSSKGMGKTLLLRYKKSLLESDRQSGMHIVPTGATLDYARIPASLNREYSKTFQDQTFWKDIWEASIALSILSYYAPRYYSIEDRHTYERHIKKLELPDELHDAIIPQDRRANKVPYNPSAVLDVLLNLGYRTLQKFRKRYMQTIKNIYKLYIQHAICVFIDSFDQALAERYPEDSEIWKAGQLGLLLASWDINRHNPHIKIYFSIRQEAYASFVNENRQTILGCLLLLKYSAAEMREMLERSVQYYEEQPSLAAFLGCTKVRNVFLNKEEDPFAYIYRHTVGTPRSMAVVGDALSRTLPASTKQNKTQERQAIIRATVNNVTAETIVTDYLRGEMRRFLVSLNNDDKLNLFFSLIRKNIMTLENMRAIAEIYSKEVAKKEGFARLHPFCELFNIGLLGAIHYDFVHNTRSQRFKQPYEFDWRMSGILPNSDYYFLHPSLQSHVCGVNRSYKVHRHVLIGNGYPWAKEYSDMLAQEKICIFISYSSFDRARVNAIAEKIKQQIERMGYFYDIWLDVWKVRGGEYIQERVEHGITESEILLLMVSEKSLNSSWVDKEWRTKFDDEISSKKVRVIPVILDETQPEALPHFLKGKKALATRGSGKLLSNSVRFLCNDICHHTIDTREHADNWIASE